MEKKKSNGGRTGRRGKYYTNVSPHIAEIKAWRSRGVEIDEIADRLKVNRSTFYKYQNEHPELKEALLLSFDKAQAYAENKIFEKIDSTDERIALDAAKFFLTHRCGYMTESQQRNTEINRQRMENSKRHGKEQNQIIKKIVGEAPSE